MTHRKWNQESWHYEDLNLAVNLLLISVFSKSASLMCIFTSHDQCNSVSYVSTCNRNGPLVQPKVFCWGFVKVSCIPMCLSCSVGQNDSSVKKSSRFYFNKRGIKEVTSCVKCQQCHIEEYHSQSEI